MPDGWDLVIHDKFSSLGFIVPKDDFKEHSLGMSCWCHPMKQEIVRPGVGVIRVLILHNALDGRA